MKSHSAHLPPAGDRRALVISGWLTGIYFLIELAIGLWSGSVAVISDAFHTFSAVGGVLIALVANRLSERPADRLRTFGFIRSEILGALFNGLFLAGMALLVIWMGAMRLMDPVHLRSGPMLAAAGGGIAVELVALGLLYRRQKGNLNMKGAYWHVVQTFVGSLLIVIAALVIRFTGWVAVDPLLGIAFGLVLLWASWGITRDSLHILMQGTPENLDIEEAIAAIRSVEGVRDVHHAHAWSLTTGTALFSSHVRIVPGTSADKVLTAVNRLLRERFGIFFSTTQVEVECVAGDEDGAAAIDITRSPRGAG